MWGVYLSVELLSNTELRNAAEQQVVHRPDSVATAGDGNRSSFREWGIGQCLGRKCWLYVTEGVAVLQQCWVPRAPQSM